MGEGYLSPQEAQEIPLSILPWRRHQQVEKKIGAMGLMNDMTLVNIAFPWRISGRGDLVHMAELRAKLDAAPAATDSPYASDRRS